MFTTGDKELEYIDQLENEIKDLRALLKKKEMVKEHVNLVNLPTKSKDTKNKALKSRAERASQTDFATSKSDESFKRKLFNPNKLVQFILGFIVIGLIATAKTFISYQVPRAMLICSNSFSKVMVFGIAFFAGFCGSRGGENKLQNQKCASKNTCGEIRDKMNKSFPNQKRHNYLGNQEKNTNNERTKTTKFEIGDIVFVNDKH